MKTIKLLIIFFAIFGFKMVSAHSLWIETTPFGEKNKTQNVRVYFGEFIHNFIDPIENWHSDVHEFKLYLISPSQQTTAIQATEHPDYFSATISPTEEAVYILKVGHPAKEVFGTSASESTVNLIIQERRKSATLTELSSTLDIEPKYHYVKDVFQDIKPKDGPFLEAKVDVVFPSGWIKKFEENGKGKICFKSLKAGKYEVAETENTKKIRCSKSIDKHWSTNTSLILVN